MSLNVIGLVSGGKDSFFSLLHCIAHGHRIVALANLHPAAQPNGLDNDDEEDLNSFMYQTVGHQVIPLYADATGLPLYRQPIVGHAVQSARDYAAAADQTDETESMTALLARVMAAHPDANAVCAGALLSTYQRTRVESVAVRLGLASLAYLWKYPLLPPGAPLDTAPARPGCAADYLDDLARCGFDARIIKVASGGLDESLLWADVASPAGRQRLRRALERLGLLDTAGSLLGEGGEYETLVVDGPRVLFPHGAIAVQAADRHVVHEGGGTAWLRIARATVAAKAEAAADAEPLHVPRPGLFDERFAHVLAVADADATSDVSSLGQLSLCDSDAPLAGPAAPSQPITTWCILPRASPPSSSIAEATQSIVDQARQRLADAATPSSSPTAGIVRTLVVLRRMADFAAFNAVYAALFADGLPNPPARVTIACDLPAGVDLAVYFGVVARASQSADAGRDGLHVQSRSYWAPANIGPYSQAVSVLAARRAGRAGRAGPRVVSVAGQIPLVPATMEFPTTDDFSSSSSSSSPSPFAFQATLALQHLWRIGIDVGVQWWSSAVAYVPKTDTTSLSLSQKVAVVAQTWQHAHAWRPKSDDDDEDDDDDGPDLWDRKFDSRYAMYGGGEDDGGPQLPDWSVVAEAEKNKENKGGPVFVAEVAGLPRGAPVEWHAHAGYSQLAKQGSRGSSVHTRSWVDPATKARTHQTVLTHVPGSDGDDSEDDDESVAKEATRLVQTVEAWPYAAAPARLPDLADVVYVDTQAVPLAASADMAAPIVPCSSLWSGRGERLSAVIVRTVYA